MTSEEDSIAGIRCRTGRTGGRIHTHTYRGLIQTRAEDARNGAISRQRARQDTIDSLLRSEAKLRHVGRNRIIPYGSFDIFSPRILQSGNTWSSMSFEIGMEIPLDWRRREHSLPIDSSILRCRAINPYHDSMECVERRGGAGSVSYRGISLREVLGEV